MLYAAFGGVAYFAGCQQVGCAITGHVPVISGPSQPKARQSFDTVAGSRLPLWRKVIFLAAQGFKYERQRKKTTTEIEQHTTAWDV